MLCTRNTLPLSFSEHWVKCLCLQLGSKCRELKDIHFGQCYKISDEGMIVIAKGCLKLQRIYMQENKLVSTWFHSHCSVCCPLNSLDFVYKLSSGYLVANPTYWKAEISSRPFTMRSSKRIDACVWCWVFKYHSLTCLLFL